MLNEMKSAFGGKKLKAFTPVKQKRFLTGFTLFKSKRYLTGFTIIELMVVCVIIGVLASVVLVSLEKSKIRTRDAERKADLTRIAGALENYRADNKVYPPGSGSVFIGLTTSHASLVPSYINTIPTDPSDSLKLYQYRSDGSQYKVAAKSETIGSGETALSAQSKAGDFYDVAAPRCFQVSSSNTALTTYSAGTYCTN